MAISPPSDLVMDVVRAADPSEMLAAQQKLQTARASLQASSLNEKNAGFDAAMSTMRATSASAKAGLGNAVTSIKNSDIPKPYKEYEGVILQNFVQSMLPKDAESVYGAGNAGSIWKSMMAEQIGNTIAERGGVGIAKQMYSEQLSKMRGKAVQNLSTDPTARNMQRMQLDQIERSTLGLDPLSSDKKSDGTTSATSS